MSTENTFCTTFCTIGLATTSSRQMSYIDATLASIVEGISAARLAEVSIVILNADLDSPDSDELERIRERYRLLIEEGILEVIHRGDLGATAAPTQPANVQSESEEAYFSWRSKQCRDYAYLFRHCRGRSRYYLHLEDDILCTKAYYERIRAFVLQRQAENWSCIRFCDLGFIGILFESEELERLAALFDLFSTELPVDWILDGYAHMRALAGFPALSYKESLFQHVGRFSSLPGKFQTAQAANFESSLKQRIFRKLGSR